MPRTQDALADYFASEAKWREMKAAEYPGDRRNAQSARALYGLAGYLSALPDGDPRVEAVRQVVAQYDPEAIVVYFEPLENPTWPIGFDRPVEDTAGFDTAFTRHPEQFLTNAVDVAATGRDLGVVTYLRRVQADFLDDLTGAGQPSPP